MPYGYRKSERLRKNTDILSVMKRGKRLSSDGLSLFYAKNGRENFRVGIVAGRKLANAVTRNRLKRRIRSGIAGALGSQALGYDLVFVARAGLLDAGYDRISKAVQDVLARTILRSVTP